MKPKQAKLCRQYGGRLLQTGGYEFDTPAQGLAVLEIMGSDANEVRKARLRLAVTDQEMLAIHAKYQSAIAPPPVPPTEPSPTPLGVDEFIFDLK